MVPSWIQAIGVGVLVMCIAVAVTVPASAPVNTSRVRARLSDLEPRTQALADTVVRTHLEKIGAVVEPQPLRRTSLVEGDKEEDWLTFKKKDDAKRKVRAKLSQ